MPLLSPIYQNVQDPKSGKNVPLFVHFDTVREFPKVAETCHFFIIFGHLEQVYKSPKVAHFKKSVQFPK